MMGEGTQRSTPVNSGRLGDFETPPPRSLTTPGRVRFGMEDPGDDRLSRWCTIMGPAGLTAVFGMGTGVAPPVSSPGRRPRAGQGPGSRRALGGPGDPSRKFQVVARVAGAIRAEHPRGSSSRARRDRTILAAASGSRIRVRLWRGCGFDHHCRPSAAAVGCGGVGSGWSSVSAVGTGRLRRSPAVHSRPIDPVVSREPS